jgi:hypothetical protein
MKIRKTHAPESDLRVPGLTDRSERPTTHELFAPMEREKQREESALRRRARRASRRRR